MIKSTTIPKQEKEKVLLALTNTSHPSNNVLNIIENHLGHKVSDIVPFLSEPASSSSSASKPKQQEGVASSSKKSVIKDSKTNKKSTDDATKNLPHNTNKNTTMRRSFWKKTKQDFSHRPT